MWFRGELQAFAPEAGCKMRSPIGASKFTETVEMRLDPGFVRGDQSFEVHRDRRDKAPFRLSIKAVGVDDFSLSQES